jgi:hypothetical protein
MKTTMTLFAFLAMMMFATSATAQNGSTNIREEVCGAFYNPCCDEWIETCVDVHYRLDRNGNLVHINYQGSGTGSNGTNYVISSAQNTHTNIQDNGAGNYTLTATVKYTATGNSDCTFSLHYTIHVTVNSNGTVTSEVQNIRVECENGTEIL